MLRLKNLFLLPLLLLSSQVALGEEKDWVFIGCESIFCFAESPPIKIPWDVSEEGPSIITLPQDIFPQKRKVRLVFACSHSGGRSGGLDRTLYVELISRQPFSRAGRGDVSVGFENKNGKSITWSGGIGNKSYSSPLDKRLILFKWFDRWQTKVDKEREAAFHSYDKLLVGRGLMRMEFSLKGNTKAVNIATEKCNENAHKSYSKSIKSQKRLQKKLLELDLLLLEKGRR